MRAMIHGVSQVPGMILGYARRAENSPKTAVSPSLRTVERAPNVRPWAGQHQSPAVFQSVVHRRTNVLVLMIVHFL